MINKKIIILAIILVSFLTISVVSAASDVAGIDDTIGAENSQGNVLTHSSDVISIDDATGAENSRGNVVNVNELENDKVMDAHDVLESQESQDELSSDNNKDVLALTSPSYSDYKVSISSQTIDYDKSGTIKISITPCTKSGYYKYDFELLILDSNKIRKLDKIYTGTSSVSSETYAVSAGKFNTGTYTMQILNRADDKVMSTATLTIKSSSNPSTGTTYPSYTSYKVSLSDTTINYGSSGSIYMSISPASGYAYTYYYTLKIFDSSNNLKASKLYSGTGYSSSQLYYMNANQLSAGTYTVKIINYADSKVMSTASLTVKSGSGSSTTYPSSSAYSVGVSSTTINYGSSGSIYMSISPASSSTYKYYYTLKVYDSSNNVKISQVYSGTSAAYSKTYTISANQLGVGTYTVKIINYVDSKVMSTASLTVKSGSGSSTTYPSSSAYSVSVSSTTINYGSSESIYMSISPASSSTYKYYYTLKVYDSSNNEKISQMYYGSSAAYSKTYSISSYQLGVGTYTAKIFNYADDNVMSTATLTVIDSNSYDDYYDDYDDYEDYDEIDAYDIAAKHLNTKKTKNIKYSVKLKSYSKYWSVKGVKLILIIDGWKTYHAKTNSKGVATFKISKLSGGKHSTMVSTDDAYDYGVILAYSYIKLPKTKLKIKAPSKTFKYHKSGKFKITIKYKSNKKAAKNIKLKLKIKTNGKYKTYKVKTNKKGIASFNTKKLKVGKHKVIISPASSSKFSGKIKSSIYIKKPVVKKAKKSSSKSSRSTKSTSSSGGGYYVASANSNKFHYSYCSAAKRIKSYNKITFSSKSQAYNAGYSSCAICNP